MTLTTVGLLAPHLTPDNHRHLLDVARHKSKREVERLIATIQPQRSVPAVVRKLPNGGAVVPSGPTIDDAALGSFGKPGVSLLTELRPTPSTARQIVGDRAKPAAVKPLDAERYKVQFTLTHTAFEKLRRVQDLMRHICPDGDVGIIFERALTVLLEQLERTKLANVSRPRNARATTSGSRHIPAAVQRAVWTRDDGRCAFVGTRGRCTERGFLEFHHLVPFADGGTAVTENIQLRCRAHNQYEADLWFGAHRSPLAGSFATRSGPS